MPSGSMRKKGPSPKRSLLGIGPQQQNVHAATRQRNTATGAGILVGLWPRRSNGSSSGRTGDECSCWSPRAASPSCPQPASAVSRSTPTCCACCRRRAAPSPPFGRFSSASGRSTISTSSSPLLTATRSATTRTTSTRGSTALAAVPEITRVDQGRIDDSRDWGWLADHELLLLDDANLREALAPPDAGRHAQRRSRRRASCWPCPRRR